MKAHVMMIGDYDDHSKTYAICLIADEAEVHASPLNEGDEVEISIDKETGDETTSFVRSGGCEEGSE